MSGDSGNVREDSDTPFKALADNITQLAWLADAHGSHIWFNRRWLTYSGRTLEDLCGQGWQQVHHPDHLTRVVIKFERCIAAGEPWEDTFPLRGADGSYRWFLSRATPVRDERGSVTFWCGTNTDITVQHQHEEALIAADRGKDAFLMQLAHELRAPLAPILSAVEMLSSKRPSDAELQRFGALIKRQTLHLSRLIDDLLDVSQAIKGKLRLERQISDINPVVQQAVETCLPVIDERRHRLTVRLSEEPLLVNVDTHRIVQVICNLLTNSAKYMHEAGDIELTINAEGNAAVIAVRDDGVGIHPEMLERVFDPFVQIDDAASRGARGLGIGLALVKQLTELHGGTVKAASQGAGTGSEFIVRLPRLHSEHRVNK